MKAIQYLQNIGAIPKYEVYDLKMAVITISSEFFAEQMAMDPECVAWTQKATTTDEFSKRCDVISYATTGDAPNLVASLEEFNDLEDLKDLIEELLEIRLFYYDAFQSNSEDSGQLEGEEWFVRNYNSLVELGPAESFPTKSHILRFFFCGALTSAGEKIIKELKRQGKI